MPPSPAHLQAVLWALSRLLCPPPTAFTLTVSAVSSTPFCPDKPQEVQPSSPKVKEPPRLSSPSEDCD